MAKAEPITAAHQGIAGGTENASIKPVITALKSPTDSNDFSLPRIRLQTHSVMTEAITQVAVTFTAYHLKKYTAAIIAGTNPMIQSSITLRVVRPLLICGAGVTTKSLSIYSLPFIVLTQIHNKTEKLKLKA
jgi:NAD(P)H-flavin reductase